METKTRFQLTLTAESYRELQALAKEAGYPQSWVSDQVDGFIRGILPLIRQAKEDALAKREMTEKEALARYGGIARKSFDDVAKEH